MNGRSVAILLLGLAVTPSVGWSSQSVIDRCMEYVMGICGPEAAADMNVLNTRTIGQSMLVTVRDGEGGEWQCRSLADGSVGEVAELDQPEARRLRFSADDPTEVIDYVLDATGTVDFTFAADVGQVVYLRVPQAATGVSYEIRDPDGTAVQRRSNTEEVYFDHIAKAGEYTVKFVGNGFYQAPLVAVVSVY